jgi:hypothetical protein
MTNCQTVDAAVPRRSRSPRLSATIGGVLSWATLVVTSVACFMSRASAGMWESTAYGIGFAVASAIAGVVVIALRGKRRWALAMGLPILFLLVAATAGLWLRPPSSTSFISFDRKYISGCLIAGYAAGAVLGLMVGLIAAAVVFISGQGRAWALAVMLGVVTFAAVRWPLGQVVEFATTLNYQLSTRTRYSNQSVWYTDSSIVGAAQGATLGALAGGILGGLAAIPRRGKEASGVPKRSR